jgi:Holliday junction resolvase
MEIVSSERIMVVKRSGEREPFSESKVRSSLQRAGADRPLIETIVGRVKGELYDGISTREIYAHVFSLLRELESPVVSRYDLKRAILELGPSGFPFERFVAGVLEARGYDVAVDQTVQGKCVDHEVDVVAHRGGKHYMIEAKFHNQPGIKSDIKDALYTHARFLDVQQAWVEIAGLRNQFYQAWLITNTKVTSKVREYARCAGMRVTSWNFPPRASLRSMVEQSGLLPITCLQSLDREARARLIAQGIVFCRELTEGDVEFLSGDRLQQVRREALQACRHRLPRSSNRVSP